MARRKFTIPKFLDKITFHQEVTNETDSSSSSPSDLQFFPNKIPLNLNNCEIIVSTGIWPPSVIDVTSNEPGIETEFILTVMQHINASVTFVVDTESWHGLTQDEQEEHSGRLALLKKEQFDLMLGSVPAHTNIFRDFDVTECYLPNSMALIVPTAGIFPSSMILWSMLQVTL